MHEETLYDLAHFLSFRYAFDPDYRMWRVTHSENNCGEHGSGDGQSFYHLESSGDDPVWRPAEQC